MRNQRNEFFMPAIDQAIFLLIAISTFTWLSFKLTGLFISYSDMQLI